MRMRRKIIDDDHNHERWLVSYADFMTLLFAFFVVMYAISSVNEGKYKILGQTLSETFASPNLSPDPIQLGEIAKTSSLHSVVTEQLSDGIDDDPGDTKFQAMEENLKEDLADLIRKDELAVSSNDQWLQVDLQSSVLFGGGQAAISNAGKALLDEVVQQFIALAYPITVEGYTDSIPATGTNYPSNWELSAARAAAVVRYFIEQGVDKSRMAAAAYGDNHPIATNATPEGRAKNRRVTLLVSRTDGVQRGLSALSGQRHREVLMDWNEPKNLEQELLSEGEPTVRAVRLDNGGVLFTDEVPPE